MREGNLKGERGLKGAQAHYDDVQMVVQGKENNLAKITNLWVHVQLLGMRLSEVLAAWKLNDYSLTRTWLHVDPKIHACLKVTYNDHSLTVGRLSADFTWLLSDYHMTTLEFPFLLRVTVIILVAHHVFGGLKLSRLFVL